MAGNNIEEHAYDGGNTKNVLIGLLIGGLAGAAAMLLFAPQSGKRTRAQIQRKRVQLRDRTNDILDNALTQVRFETHEIAAGVREQAGELRQIGQDRIVKQLDRVSALLDAGKTAIKDA